MSKARLPLLFVCLVLGALIWLSLRFAHDAPRSRKAIEVTSMEDVRPAPTGGPAAPGLNRPRSGRELAQGLSESVELVIHGRVRGPHGAAVPGARVFGSISAPDEASTGFLKGAGIKFGLCGLPDLREGALALGSVESDLDGHFKLSTELLQPGLAAGVPVHLRLFATSPHNGSGETWGVWIVGGEDLELDLTVDPRPALHGRLIDERDFPIVGARVELLRFELEEGEGQRKVQSWARTDNEGRFLLAAKEPGRYRVHARAAQRGVATSDWRVLRAGAEDVGSLVLQGGGQFAGVLTHADGTPAAGIELFALPLEFSDLEPTRERLEDWILQRESGAGLALGRAQSDHTGRFTFGGLAPGRYRIRPRDAGCVLADPARRYATGDLEMQLRIRSRRLQIRVEDLEGRALGGARVLCGEVFEDSEWKGLPGMNVLLRGHVVARGSGLELFVPPDLERIGICADRLERGSVEHVIELSKPRTEIVLRLPERGGSGQLRARIRAQAGGGLPAYKAELRLARSGAPLRVFSLQPPERELSGPLPPGSYHVRLVPQGSTESHPMPLPIVVLEEIQIQAGETTEIELQPRNGGRLEIVLSGAALMVEKPPQVRVELADDPDHPRPVHFGARINRKARARSSKNRPLTAQDAGGTSQAIEPGEHVLYCHLDGELRATRTVTVVEGRLTRVVFDLP